MSFGSEVTILSHVIEEESRILEHEGTWEIVESGGAMRWHVTHCDFRFCDGGWRHSWTWHPSHSTCTQPDHPHHRAWYSHCLSEVRTRRGLSVVFQSSELTPSLWRWPNQVPKGLSLAEITRWWYIAELFCNTHGTQGCPNDSSQPSQRDG